MAKTEEGLEKIPISLVEDGEKIGLIVDLDTWYYHEKVSRISNRLTANRMYFERVRRFRKLGASGNKVDG